MPGIMAGLDQLVQTVRAAVAVIFNVVMSFFVVQRPIPRHGDSPVPVHLVVDVLVVLRDPRVAARSETH